MDYKDLHANCFLFNTIMHIIIKMNKEFVISIKLTKTKEIVFSRYLLVLKFMHMYLTLQTKTNEKYSNSRHKLYSIRTLFYVHYFTKLDHQNS